MYASSFAGSQGLQGMQQGGSAGSTTFAGAVPSAATEKCQFLFKFIIVGDEGVGKTCLLLQFVDGRYRTKHEVTVGVEFGSKALEIDGKVVKLQCWDTAGQDRYRSIVRSYYRGSAAALLVYDITSRASFNHVISWLREAREHADTNLVITLVGNKCDLGHKREVSYEEGLNLAATENLQFVETSAVDATNVEDAFTQTAAIVYRANVGFFQNNANEQPWQDRGIKLTAQQGMPAQQPQPSEDPCACA
ncbi:unnamed protein product [Amoebophrya sp. A25]|nr:unnamed protein product [Amoebophrya sp. A25]|eukprot:GSA25T00007767001.1